MIEIKYKDNSIAEDGDIIKWNSEDKDDWCVYEMLGIYKTDHIIYLCGGIDFGTSFGKILSIEEVIEESTDCDNPGIIKIGDIKQLASYIRKFNGT